MNSLINILKDHEVETVFFCSGSRNASLELGLSKNFELYHCYEERQAAFMALGQAKYTKKPVVVCTTSGTAVLECISALAEAYYSDVKLIILSADRPKRLQNTAAPQTIDQVTPLRPFVKTQIDTTLQDLDKLSLSFPAQINLQIDDSNREYPCNLEFVDKVSFSNFIKNKRALFIVTSGYNPNDLKKIVESMINANHFVHLDKSANVNLDYEVNNIIYSDKACDKLINENLVDCVIRIGHTPLVKLWRDLDRLYVDLDVFHIDPRGFQALARGDVWKLDYSDINILNELIEKNNFKKIDFKDVSPNELLKKYHYSEPTFFYNLSNLIEKDSIVYLGNSMPIRYWQLVSQRSDVTVLSSRGANGIDGQISTAIGIAKKSTKNVYTILGDITTLYDIGALTQMLPKNFKLVILNNKGGRIFEQIGKSGGIVNEHDNYLTNLISGFNISTAKFNEPNQLSLQAQVIELLPELEQTRLFWKEWKEL